MTAWPRHHNPASVASSLLARARSEVGLFILVRNVSPRAFVQALPAPGSAASTSNKAANCSSVSHIARMIIGRVKYLKGSAWPPRDRYPALNSHAQSAAAVIDGCGAYMLNVIGLPCRWMLRTTPSAICQGCRNARVDGFVRGGLSLKEKETAPVLCTADRGTLVDTKFGPGWPNWEDAALRFP